MASWAPDMFGDVLVGKDGEVNTAEALKDKVVGVYFSAHWCPPCRGFTPKLAEIYKDLKDQGKNFEIVFASSDKSEEEFKGYHAEQPWLAMPFANRDAKAKLAKKFKVGGIPTLVILDEKGATVNKDGRSAVMEPQKFPWVPPTLAEVLGDTFVDKTGATKKLSEITGAGKNIGLYFSAHWCGPCRQFTPKLVKMYEKLTGEGKPFEVIFVSSDRDTTQFEEYYGEMPWLALPFNDRQRKEALSQFFGIEGIPSFVMVSPELKVLNHNARGNVSGDPEGAEFPWKPKLVTDVDEECDGINDTPTVVVLMEEAGDKWDELTAAMTAVAKEVRSGEEERGEESRGVLFMVVTETGGGIGAQLRKLCGLGRPSASPEMVFLDLGEGGYVNFKNADDADAGGVVDEASIRRLVGDYKAGKLSLESPKRG